MKQLITSIILLFALSGFAQNDTAFIYTYGGAANDEGKDIIQTADSGYIILGSTSSFGNGSSDFYVIKLDSNFQVEWTNAYGGPQIETGESILPADDGGYHLLGSTNSFGSGGYDVYYVKIDAQGEFEYDDSFGGSNWDFGYDMVYTPEGDIMVVGETYSFNGGDAQAYVLKLDEFATIQWEKTIGGSKHDLARSIILTEDSHCVFTGENESIRDSMSTDIWLYKMDTDGKLIWQEIYGGKEEDIGADLVEDDSFFYITGSSKSYSRENDFNEHVIKTNLDGSFLWYRDRKDNGFGQNLDDLGLSIFARPNGRILVTGSGKTFGSGSSDFIISDLNDSGFENSESGSFGGVLTDIGHKIFCNNNFDIFILGKSNSYNGLYFDVALLRMDTLFKYSPTDISIEINIIDTTSSSIPSLSIPKKINSEIHSTTIEASQEYITISNHEDNRVSYVLTDLNGRIIDKGIIQARSFTILNRPSNSFLVLNTYGSMENRHKIPPSFR